MCYLLHLFCVCKVWFNPLYQMALFRFPRCLAKTLKGEEKVSKFKIAIYPFSWLDMQVNCHLPKRFIEFLNNTSREHKGNRTGVLILMRFLSSKGEWTRGDLWEICFYFPPPILWYDFQYLALGTTSKGTPLLHCCNSTGREIARLSWSGCVEQLSWECQVAHPAWHCTATSTASS